MSFNNLYDFFMIFDQFVSYLINIFVRQQILIVRLFRLFCFVSQFILQIFYTQLSQFSPFLRHSLFLTPQFTSYATVYFLRHSLLFVSVY